MEEKIHNLKNEALAQILSVSNLSDIETLRVQYLGRKGKINDITQDMGKVEPEKRAMVGRMINDTRAAIETMLSEKETEFGKSTSTWFDSTIPGEKPKRGHAHLVTQAIDEIASIFQNIGFVRVRYPEVEWDWYAFEALNMPKEHPARDEWETFFIDAPESKKYGKQVLTPHTSSGQIREMERVKTPPIRMINIAKCYRRQSDISHVPMFHQFEGLVVDTDISIAHLKGTLDYFARNFFGKDRVTRLRPYNFEFTEPSFEVDITCGVCGGTGTISIGKTEESCRLCKAGWLELGGAGMVHPNVLKAVGIDSKKYTGFAFGWGVERTFMMKSGLSIGDVRMMYSPDLRFLRQF